MQIILTETMAKLGRIGDEVEVRDGFARNFLIPQGKALRASKANRELFVTIKKEIEKANVEKHNLANRLVAKLNGVIIDMIRQAGDDGKLFGSISARDISNALNDLKFQEITRNHIVIDNPIKFIGTYDIKISLYAEIYATVHLNVARTEDEASEARKKIVTERAQKLDTQEVIEV